MTSENPGTGTRFIDGLEVRRQVMGEEYVERAFANTAGTDSAALQAFVTDTVWGGVWTRPGLDHRSRSLLNIGMLIALRSHDELAGHVRGGLRNGLTRQEISETVIHTAGYCGAPAALAAMRVVQKVLDEELGPLAP
ncbi:4-carboxymuconolactone decarboxylase [Rhodococcus sp. 05-2255-3B1]|uniref:carboxymuconolactone decarboxylase family protein n=1 Tax=unclassified Rhodococcus (in: high G+C Gram-positive bacteria) TaxID=192944 RepID=UPI000B9B978C|nr:MULTISPECIES: carboxymuconolactone decarboxylase family protein [unclassified Rhodococcus (in: high G+C Gram-positive bacteria)]OZE01687.1 4-carboxymuconolactone decarboxylase [Rhodococcus sp. 05-2255-3C]OZE07283.1 4-carboxymuconolactone decarboxylase [Rhodococcus sp. 05-2255-3B1]OZE17210.1 4-carboxymuconolactone decarboxylase [Rhodococcus sp. 05-2255-2A2]